VPETPIAMPYSRGTVHHQRLDGAARDRQRTAVGKERAADIVGGAGEGQGAGPATRHVPSELTLALMECEPASTVTLLPLFHPLYFCFFPDKRRDGAEIVGAMRRSGRVGGAWPFMYMTILLGEATMATNVHCWSGMYRAGFGVAP